MADRAVFVVMPTYNRPLKCKNVISQLISQTYEKWKLLIIDDGSDASNYAILSEHVNSVQDNRITLIRNDTNLKLPATLNVGLKYFLSDNSCTYFTWVSDDNILYSNFIQTLVSNCTGFCFTAMEFSDTSGNNSIEKRGRSYASIQDIMSNFAGMAAFMWGRYAIKRIGFYNEDLFKCEDYDYLIRTYAALDLSNIKYVDTITMRYILHQGSLYSTYKQEIRTMTTQINAAYLDESSEYAKRTTNLIVYYSKTPYTKLFQRPHQIMRFFDKSYRKIFITGESTPDINYKFEHMYGLTIVPYADPDIRSIIKSYKSAIIYYTDSRLADEVCTIKNSRDQSTTKILFDLIDAPIAEFRVWMPKLADAVNRADHVMYSHPDLVKYLNNINPNRPYYYISNGCDIEFFSQAQNRMYPRPADIPQTDKPILGYYGAFAEWLDYDLIRRYADDNTYHILMIGGLTDCKTYNMRFVHPNITWLYHKPYDGIPRYLSWFDACFIPFRECELNLYKNPCKLYEYMASGKPIIKHGIKMDNPVIVTYTQVCADIRNIIDSTKQRDFAYYDLAEIADQIDTDGYFTYDTIVNDFYVTLTDECNLCMCTDIRNTDVMVFDIRVTHNKLNIVSKVFGTNKSFDIDLTSDSIIIDYDYAESIIYVFITGRNMYISEKIKLNRIMASKKDTACASVTFIEKYVEPCNILSYTYYNIEGTRLYKGGAERYLEDLTSLLHKWGYRTTLYQFGNRPFEYKYKNMYIKSILSTGANAFSYGNILASLDYFESHKASLKIYSPFILNLRKTDNVPSISISHGVFWDNNYMCYASGTASQGIYSFQNFKSSLEKTCKNNFFVSVDANTINVLQSMYGENMINKCIYVPNYVDTDIFTYRQPFQSNKIRIIYPRRIYKARGYLLVTESIEYLLNKYPNIEIYFIGQYDSKEDETNITKYIAKYPDRVFKEEYESSKMKAAYEKADISLIPTIYSEGTSLSCLEAMSTGNIVISTYIGGLSNIIIDGHNGYLINPTSESLISKIEHIINKLQSNDHIRKISQNARATVIDGFSQNKWFDEYTKILSTLNNSHNILSITDLRNNDVIDISLILNKKIASYKNILIYPQTVKYKPLQRPQHLMKNISSSDTLCLFFSDSQTNNITPYDNLIVIESLFATSMAVIKNIISDTDQNKKIIMYISWCLIYEKICPLIVKPNIVVWYDLLDDISHSANYGPTSVYYHNVLLESADLITYSYKRLITDKIDSLYIPNAFSDSIYEYIDRTIEPSKDAIYFGAIANYFDIAAVRNISKCMNITLVGRCDDPDILEQINSMPNVTYAGYMEYDTMLRFSNNFRYGLIPFVVRDDIDSVDPVKYYEYKVIGLIILTTCFGSMRQKIDNRTVLEIDQNTDINSIITSTIGLTKTEIYETFPEKDNTWKRHALTIKNMLHIESI